MLQLSRHANNLIRGDTVTVKHTINLITDVKLQKILDFRCDPDQPSSPIPPADDPYEALYQYALAKNVGGVVQTVANALPEHESSVIFQVFKEKKTFFEHRVLDCLSTEGFAFLKTKPFKLSGSSIPQYTLPFAACPYTKRCFVFIKNKRIVSQTKLSGVTTPKLKILTHWMRKRLREDLYVFEFFLCNSGTIRLLDVYIENGKSLSCCNFEERYSVLDSYTLTGTVEKAEVCKIIPGEVYLLKVKDQFPEERIDFVYSTPKMSLVYLLVGCAPDLSIAQRGKEPQWTYYFAGMVNGGSSNQMAIAGFTTNLKNFEHALSKDESKNPIDGSAFEWFCQKPQNFAYLKTPVPIKGKKLVASKNLTITPHKLITTKGGLQMTNVPMENFAVLPKMEGSLKIADPMTEAQQVTLSSMEIQQIEEYLKERRKPAGSATTAPRKRKSAVRTPPKEGPKAKVIKYDSTD
ncbi:MAG: hypothetical protein MUO31_05480 [Thermodesulfovibrionales bacterium]|nr:hypothetical protein [Thermodesulfovibrionales bacterium]